MIYRYEMLDTGGKWREISESDALWAMEKAAEHGSRDGYVTRVLEVTTQVVRKYHNGLLR